jgi:hypothetical protein
MRYYIKCKLKPDDRRRLADSLHSGSLARNKIFYEGMQTALREGTIDENGIVHFIEGLLLLGRRIISYGYGNSCAKGIL